MNSILHWAFIIFLAGQFANLFKWFLQLLRNIKGRWFGSRVYCSFICFVIYSKKVDVTWEMHQNRTPYEKQKPIFIIDLLTPIIEIRNIKGTNNA